MIEVGNEWEVKEKAVIFIFIWENKENTLILVWERRYETAIFTAKRKEANDHKKLWTGWVWYEWGK